MVRVWQILAPAAVPCCGQDLFLRHADSPPAYDVVVPAGSTTDNYEPDCKSDDDKGWPRFNSVDELRASKWATYFLEVYGELPAEYPVCIHDFWWLNDEALEKANITELAPVEDLSDLNEGDLFPILKGPSGLPGGFGIYHETYEPAPANTWVEIAHTAYPSEMLGMWCWRTRGSGVWFNTGNTMTFPSHTEVMMTHHEAISYLRDGCTAKVSPFWPQVESDIFGTCAREKGLDSIQFAAVTDVKPIGTFGFPGMTELVITGNDGQYNCGTEHASETTLRSGWKASQKCDCENLPVDLTCGIMPHGSFPFYPPLARPPVCKVQRYTFWKACDPSTCSTTFCKTSSHRKQEVATAMLKWSLS